MITFICIAVAILWALYKVYTSTFSYFAKKGIPYVEPSFPYGSMKEVSLFKTYQGYGIQKLYKKLDKSPYGGFFFLREPMLLIRDPEIIQHILIKDFSHFRDRHDMIRDPKVILSQHLFSIQGEQWRALRVKLTPTFTSGKLKSMFPLFEACSKDLVDFLKEKAASKAAIDVKDVTANFTTDIIGTCAFGLEIGSMQSRNNQFREIGKKIFPPYLPLKLKLVVWILKLWLSLRYFIRLNLVDTTIADFILSVVRDTVQYREKNNIVRQDFLHLLIELKNKKFLETQNGNDGTSGTATMELTMELLAAQCFVFFAAGFETSSSVMSYCFFELAKNKEIQDKLRKEIDQVSAQHGGITYQALQEMTYLGQVIDETIRKYPTLPQLERVCVQKYRMPDSGVIIDKGTMVIIPVYSLHHDPKYYPDPEKFDPDRFLPERKALIPSCAYLPFGEGPRLCIGMRFGLLQTKMGVASILSNFELSLTNETQNPLKFIASQIVSAVEGPINLQISHRDKKISIS